MKLLKDDQKLISLYFLDNHSKITRKKMFSARTTICYHLLSVTKWNKTKSIKKAVLSAPQFVTNSFWSFFVPDTS